MSDVIVIYTLVRQSWRYSFILGGKAQKLCCSPFFSAMFSSVGAFIAFSETGNCCSFNLSKTRKNGSLVTKSYEDNFGSFPHHHGQPVRAEH